MGNRNGSNRDLTADSWRETWQELVNSSDRSAGIVGASVLEQGLAELLAARFVDDPSVVDSLLYPHQGIGLSRAARLAYCIGLIGRTQLADFSAVAKIRNYFAHHLDCRSFDDQEPADLVKTLESHTVFAGSREGSTREQYNRTVSALMYWLMAQTARAEHIAERQPQSIRDTLSDQYIGGQL